MIWFAAALLFLIIGIFYKKSKGKMPDSIISDGEIIYIDTEKKEITVRYTENGKTIDFTASENYGDFLKLKVGQKILVNTRISDHKRTISGLYNVRGKDRTMKGSQNAAFIISAVCFVMGIVSLF